MAPPLTAWLADHAAKYDEHHGVMPHVNRAGTRLQLLAITGSVTPRGKDPVVWTRFSDGEYWVHAAVPLDLIQRYNATNSEKFESLRYSIFKTERYTFCYEEPTELERGSSTKVNKLSRRLCVRIAALDRYGHAGEHPIKLDGSLKEFRLGEGRPALKEWAGRFEREQEAILDNSRKLGKEKVKQNEALLAAEHRAGIHAGSPYALPPPEVVAEQEAARKPLKWLLWGGYEQRSRLPRTESPSGAPVLPLSLLDGPDIPSPASTSKQPVKKTVSSKRAVSVAAESEPSPVKVVAAKVASPTPPPRPVAAPTPVQHTQLPPPSSPVATSSKERLPDSPSLVDPSFDQSNTSFPALGQPRASAYSISHLPNDELAPNQSAVSIPIVTQVTGQPVAGQRQRRQHQQYAMSSDEEEEEVVFVDDEEDVEEEEEDDGGLPPSRQVPSSSGSNDKPLWQEEEEHAPTSPGGPGATLVADSEPSGSRSPETQRRRSASSASRSSNASTRSSVSPHIHRSSSHAPRRASTPAQLASQYSPADEFPPRQRSTQLAAISSGQKRSRSSSIASDQAAEDVEDFGMSQELGQRRGSQVDAMELDGDDGVATAARLVKETSPINSTLVARASQRSSNKSSQDALGGLAQQQEDQENVPLAVVNEDDVPRPVKRPKLPKESKAFKLPSFEEWMLQKGFKVV